MHFAMATTRMCMSLLTARRLVFSVQVTGIYRNQYDLSLNKQQGFPVFQTLIEANFVAQSEAVDLDLTEEDIEHIRTLAKDPQIGEKIVNRYTAPQCCSAPAPGTRFAGHTPHAALRPRSTGGKTSSWPWRSPCLGARLRSSPPRRYIHTRPAV